MNKLISSPYECGYCGIEAECKHPDKKGNTSCYSFDFPKDCPLPNSKITKQYPKNNVIYIRNEEYWRHIQFFVRRHVEFPTQHIKLIGYFPYHTARVTIKDNNIFPCELFEEFRKLLVLCGIFDNKSVYICKTTTEFNVVNTFAIMFKDTWVSIGTWNQVTSYYGKPLKEI